MTETTPTLSTLQNWTRDDWEAYEPCLWGNDPSPKRVIGTIIRAAERELEWRGESESNSLRDFWYNPTKPILQEAFPEKLSDDSFDFNRRMSQYLSDKMSEMVKEGEISYKSLNILDNSRSRELHFDSTEDDKIIFAEKEAAYRKLKPLEEVYELSIVSGGGWQSTALIEDLARELDEKTSYTIYILTDFDPTGFKIGHDFENRAEKLGVDIEEVRRIGIRPDQLDAAAIEEQKFIPESKTDWDEEWMDEYAIEGEYGLEIEALGQLGEKGKALRRVVVEEIRDDLNVRRRRQRAASSATAAATRSAVEGVVDEIVEDLETAIREAAIEEVSSQPGMSASYEDGLYRGRADIDEIDTDAEYTPDVYDEEELHEAAIEGSDVFAGTLDLQRWLSRRLEAKIEEGEIDVDELL